MRIASHLQAHARRYFIKTGLARLRSNQDGATATEFAIVAMPFFMFVLGVMGVASYFFIFTSLDKGMDQESRLIRTGQAQQSNLTVKQFKDDLCNKAGSWVKCNKVQVFVQKFADWASIDPQPCIAADGSAVVNAANENDEITKYSGEANDIVLVTTCYQWEFASKVPFIKLGQMRDGSMMMQTATAFRTEPYSSTP